MESTQEEKEKTESSSNYKIFRGTPSTEWNVATRFDINEYLAFRESFGSQFIRMRFSKLLFFLKKI